MNALLLVLLMSQVDVPPPPVEDNFPPPAPIVGLTQAQDQSAKSTVCQCGCGRVGCTCQIVQTTHATSSVQVYSGWGPWRPWRRWHYRSASPATTETRTKVYRSGKVRTYSVTRHGG